MGPGRGARKGRSALVGQRKPPGRGFPAGLPNPAVRVGRASRPDRAAGAARGAGQLRLPADEGLARALSGAYPINIGDWMSRGWTVFTQAGGLFIAFGAVIWLLHTFASPLLLVLGPVLSAGFLVAALIVRRGGTLQFSDFWLPFNDFIPIFLVWIVSAAFILLGLLTCGIVTIWLYVGYQFAYLLVVDRKLDFWEALEASRKAVQKQWLALFAFALLLFGINLVAYIGTLTLGIVVSLPLTACALVEAYADIYGIRGGMPGGPRSR